MERSEQGRGKGKLKFTALNFFQEMASMHKRHEERRSEEKVGTLRKGKRKARPLGSSQMTVLQLQQQDIGYEGKSLVTHRRKH